MSSWVTREDQRYTAFNELNVVASAEAGAWRDTCTVAHSPVVST